MKKKRSIWTIILSWLVVFFGVYKPLNSLVVIFIVASQVGFDNYFKTMGSNFLRFAFTFSSGNFYGLNFALDKLGDSLPIYQHNLLMHPRFLVNYIQSIFSITLLVTGIGLLLSKRIFLKIAPIVFLCLISICAADIIFLCFELDATFKYFSYYVAHIIKRSLWIFILAYLTFYFTRPKVKEQFK